MKRMAWITCRVLPEPDPDEAPVVAALEEVGIEVQRVAWDDGAPSGAPFDLAVLRSPWNYYEDPRAFLAWLATLAESTPVWNRLPVVRWNHHKAYLGALESAGLPIVPTAWFDRGSASDLGALTAERGWDEVVVKPTISAGSYSTRRFQREDPDGQGFLTATLSERDMLVQPYLPTVETTGEKSLVWIDGAFTHAIVKEPRYAEDDEAVSEAVPVEPSELALGDHALDAACADGGFGRADLLYARVDLMELEGRWVLSELELMEPSLFLLQAPAALERFVAAVRARL